MNARLLSAVVAFVCFLGIGGIVATGASAETMNYPSDPLQPAPTKPPTGPTTLAQPMNGTFVCSLPFVTIQADASGFAIGTCPQGTHLRRSVKSDVYTGHTWDGGHIFGNYEGCGWIQSDFSSLAGNSTENLCPNGPTVDPQLFQIIDNNDTNAEGVPGGCGWKPDSQGNYRCTDGTVTTTTAACTLYGNVRPWLPNQYGTDPIRTIPAGQQVRWRYVSQYPAAGGGAYWVMVRDMANNTDGYGNWGFVSAACLPSPVLPGDRWLG